MNGPDLRAVTPARQIRQDRKGTEARHELGGVGRREQRGECRELLGPGSGERQQRRDVVVTQQPAAADARPQPQDRQRVRPAVDQVTQTPQLVSRRIEADRLQERIQLPGASLNVSHQPAHVSSDAVKELT
jgi:hypothetical protein